MLYGSGGGGPGAKPDVLIRIISCVPYLVPLLDSLMYGRFVFEKVPALSTFVLNPLVPLYSLYRGIPFLAFGIFLALYFLVVRNTNVPRFIRFNAQQAITLDILLIVPQLFSSFAGSNVIPNNIVEMASNSVFYSMLLAVIYAVVTNLKGEYPDQIPGVSESVESQIGPF